MRIDGTNVEVLATDGLDRPIEEGHWRAEGVEVDPLERLPSEDLTKILMEDPDTANDLTMRHGTPSILLLWEARTRVRRVHGMGCSCPIEGLAVEVVGGDPEPRKQVRWQFMEPPSPTDTR